MGFNIVRWEPCTRLLLIVRWQREWWRWQILTFTIPLLLLPMLVLWPLQIILLLLPLQMLPQMLQRLLRLLRLLLPRLLLLLLLPVLLLLLLLPKLLLLLMFWRRLAVPSLLLLLPCLVVNVPINTRNIRMGLLLMIEWQW